MKINIAKREARNIVRKGELPPGEYGVEALNPRGGIAKPMEMSARRSIALHNALAIALSVTGTVEGVKGKQFIGDTDVERQLKVALGDRPYRSTTMRHGWDWVIDYWWEGGLKRSLDAALLNMPEENRKRVEKEMSKMQSIETGDDE